MTHQQARLLQFIIDYQRENAGACPSYKEMASGILLRSRSGIHRMLLRLEEEGYIERSSHCARAIRVTQLAMQKVPVQTPLFAAHAPSDAVNDAAKPRDCNVIAAEIAKLLPFQARLKQLRIELGRAQSRDRLIAMKSDPAIEVRRLAGVSLAMAGNKNGAGHRKSQEARERIAEKMKGNTNCVGRNVGLGVVARNRAQQRGIPVLPSPAPGMRGLCPDYATDRVVFYAANLPGAP